MVAVLLSATTGVSVVADGTRHPLDEGEAQPNSTDTVPETSDCLQLFVCVRPVSPKHAGRAIILTRVAGGATGPNYIKLQSKVVKL